MNYSQNPAMVRVDFFKESGKWYATEQMEWTHWSGKFLIHDVFAWCLISNFNGHYHDMTAVCLKPCHEHAHPIMLHKWQTYKPAPLKLS